jgi:hypothetical protein
MRTAIAIVKVEVEIPEGAEAITDTEGVCYGYTLPDGRRVDPALCLRVESEDGTAERYAVTYTEFSDLGFSLNSYNEVTFESEVVYP